MIQLIDNKKTYNYFDKYGLMLERQSWGDGGKGDSAWRTAQALISATKPEDINEITNNIMFHLIKETGILRHPEAPKDTSRDQVIMLDVAFRLVDPSCHEHMKKICKFRISEKFTWQNNWFWFKDRYLLWRITNFYLLFFLKTQPPYAIHILCWMIYVSGQKVPLLRKKLLKIIPEKNYLLR